MGQTIWKRIDRGLTFGCAGAAVNGEGIGEEKEDLRKSVDHFG